MARLDLGRDSGARPPRAHLLATEGGRAVGELAAFVAVSPLLRALPRGDAHPVLVLPGFLAGDESTLALRRSLRGLGYWVHGWRLGRNVGPTRQVIDGMDRLLERLSEQHGRTVSIVGWSLGGVFGRELARRSPASVRQVLTLGSPFRLSDPSQSRASHLFERYSRLHVDTEELPTFRDGGQPLPVPATAVYTRGDGVVSWRACVDVPGRRSENVEVRGSHLGLGHNASALYVIADRLAQAEGSWTPFVAPRLLRHLYPAAEGARSPA